MKLLLLLFSGLKYLKFGKLFATGGTMLLSVAVYAFVFGWRYAAGFVLLLLVHELGHYIAARQRGLDVGAPVFIPFVGAWIQLKEMPHDADTEAYVGLGGPLAGTVASLACYFAARSTGSDLLLLALSYAGFFINLFNLIPLSPFDGGRITAVLSPRIWLVGVPVLVALFFWRPSPILILVAVLALPNVLRAFKYDPSLPENQAYYGTTLESKLTYTCDYLGLVCVLAIMAHDVHDMLGHLRG